MTDDPQWLCLGCGRSSRSATPELHAPDCPFVRPQMAGDERDLPAELAQEPLIDVDKAIRAQSAAQARKGLRFRLLWTWRIYDAGGALVGERHEWKDEGSIGTIYPGQTWTVHADLRLPANGELMVPQGGRVETLVRLAASDPEEDEMSFPPRREVPPPPEPQRPPTIDYTGKVADDGLHIVAYVLIILVFLAGVAVGAVGAVLF
jgi:hypothetical protein